MGNCVSINLRKNEIIIKIAEDAEQKKIISELTKKLSDLKKLYKEYKTPIKIVWKVLKNKPKKYWKDGLQRKRSPLAGGSRTHSDWKVQWEKNRAVIG